MEVAWQKYDSQSSKMYDLTVNNVALQFVILRIGARKGRHQGVMLQCFRSFTGNENGTSLSARALSLTIQREVKPPPNSV
jgi:hypothetical protein